MKHKLMALQPRNEYYSKSGRESRFILGSFPLSWEQRKLGEVLTLLKDGTHGTHLDVENGPLLLSAKNIKNGSVSWDDTDRRISQKDYEAIHSSFKLITKSLLCFL